MRLIPAFVLSICAALPLHAEGALPPAVLKRIKEAPARFLADAADLIHGYGGPQGIDRAGVETHIALERASARARALRRFWEADLDADGTVTLSEMRSLATSADAAQRGRIMAQFAQADGDGDGQVAPAELRVQAEGAALRAMSEAKAAGLVAILAFDADGNGSVTLSEVAREVEALAGGG